MTVFSLWVDEDNALEQLAQRAAGNEFLHKAGKDMIEKGWTFIEGPQRILDCEDARADYVKYIQENPSAQNAVDVTGKHFRLANFHTYSEAAMRIGKNSTVMSVLDFIFGRRAAVYTSLTFEYSTEQPLHRDVPFFYTFPEGQFLGAWTALEDIHLDAGPLCYISGSHKFNIDHKKLYADTLLSIGAQDRALKESLRRYNLIVAEEALKIGPREYIMPKAGDTFIWHPQLVHGGSPQNNPNLSRNSMVFHCCPETSMVYIEDVFFAWDDAVGQPARRFTLASSYGRSHANYSTANFGNGR